MAVGAITIPLRQTAAGSTAENTNENIASSFSLKHTGAPSGLELRRRYIMQLQLSVTPVTCLHV
jgi:hypothetical protein